MCDEIEWLTWEPVGTERIEVDGDEVLGVVEWCTKCCEYRFVVPDMDVVDRQ